VSAFEWIRYILTIGITAGIVVMLLRKRLIRSKSRFFIVAFVSYCVVGVAISNPIAENTFINFKTPQSVYSYTRTGEVDGILQGNESSMVFGALENKGFEYVIVPKRDERYKIPSILSVRKISERNDTAGFFRVYHVLNTDDYYVVGSVYDKTGSVKVLDQNGHIVDTPVKRLNNEITFAFFAEDYQEGYSVVVNEKKVSISK
jgi:hypothetical protein